MTLFLLRNSVLFLAGYCWKVWCLLSCLLVDVCLISVVSCFQQKMRIPCCFPLDFYAIVVITLFDGVVAVAVGVVGHVSQQRVVRVRVFGTQAVSVCSRVRAASPGELPWETMRNSLRHDDVMFQEPLKEVR